MKRHVLPLLIMLAIFGGAAYLLLNTTFFISSAVPKIIRSYYKDIELDTFSVGQQRFILPDTLLLKDVAADFVYRRTQYNVRLDQVTFHDFRKLWQLRQQVKMSGKGLRVIWDEGDVQDVSFESIVLFNTDAFVERIDSIMKGGQLQYAQYQIDRFTGRVKGDRKKLELFEVTAKGYGGSMQGQVQVDFKPDLTYVFWVEFNDLQTEAMKDVYSPLFKNVTTTINGNLRLLGDRERITLLDINCLAPQQATLKREIAERIIPQLSNPDQQDRLQSLLDGHPDLTVDEAMFSLRSLNDYSATINFGLREEASGLYVRDDVRIAINAGLKGLLIQRRPLKFNSE